MARKYRAAVIGCGNIGMTAQMDSKRLKPASHAAMYASHPRAELVGLADISEKQIEIAGQLYPNTPVFTNYEKLLDETRPDIVSVATINEWHAPVVLSAAHRKVSAIVCEKPIADNITAGKVMVEACGDSGSLLFVNHSRRFNPFLREWRQKIQGGFIGDIQQVTAWHAMGLYEMGTHMIDFLRFYLGEVKSVRGWINKAAKPLHENHENDISVDARIEFQSGVLAMVQNVNMDYYRMFQVRFLGTKSELLLHDVGVPTFIYTPVVDSKLYKGVKTLGWNYGDRGSQGERQVRYNSELTSIFAPLVDHVLDCLDGKDSPASNGEDGLETLRVLNALSESSKLNGGEVVLDE